SHWSVPDELVHYSCLFRVGDIVRPPQTEKRSRMVFLLNILFNILSTSESIVSLFHFERTEIHETRCRSSVYVQFHSASIPSMDPEGDRNGR
ncbi:hypothetical protein K439DRAFT_1640138, partial [Ramaria rubella]